jgi:hypothetical protein
MRKTWLLIILLFITVVSKAQYRPNFPHSISRPEYINRAHYAWQTNPTFSLNWGKQSDEYATSANAPYGFLTANVNIPVSWWNTSFGAMILAQAYGNYVKVNADVHAAAKVKLIDDMNTAMGISMGIESTETVDYNTGNVLKTSNYASAGLAMQYHAMYIGSALHYTHLHPNGVFNGKNFTYYLDIAYLFSKDEISWMKPAFIYTNYEGKSFFEMGITARFNQWFSSGIAYRFDQAIMLNCDIEFYKKTTFGLGYYYNFKEYQYLSNGIFEVHFKMKFNPV